MRVLKVEKPADREAAEPNLCDIGGGEPDGDWRCVAVEQICEERSKQGRDQRECVVFAFQSPKDRHGESVW